MKRSVICHLSDFAPEYPGSFVDALLCLAHHCRERFQIDTMCVFPQHAKERTWVSRFQNAGVAVGFLPRQRNVVLPLMRLLENSDPVIIHSHFDTYDVSGIALKIARYRDAKVVWHFHSTARLTVKQRLKDAIKVQCLARNFVDLFISAADGAYQNALDRGFPQGRLSLSHNGIDTVRFSSDGERRNEARSLLGVSSDQVVFLLLGYSPLVKGVDVFIKAADELQRRSTRSHIFLIVARDDTRRFIAQLPEANRLGSAIRIIDPIQDFRFLLDAIDVLVAASRREAGLSYAVLEAMATAKPVLCSDIPGVRENCGNMRGVRLFPNEDWKSLASLMQSVSELSPAERNAFGQLNSRYVIDHYSLETWATNVGNLYSTLLPPAV